jgi:aspartate kinase
MKVFKFGGASVKDAGAVKNVAEIVKNYSGNKIVIVVSAMGKTTNALEDTLQLFFEKGNWQDKLNEIKNYHFNILDELFQDNSHPVYDELDSIFMGLEINFEKEFSGEFDFLYDQVVSHGELISTKIISSYLNKYGIKNRWIDARNFIITDGTHREARINWNKTPVLIKNKIAPILEKTPIVTQGFIGSTTGNITTTLGREGSDYTAAIFSFSLDAEETVIWKDVPGVLSADPKKFDNPVKFDKLSYEEAIEMTYYGATVIHPKTIKPLQNKKIPLIVKSFIKPEDEGTYIGPGILMQKDVPIHILKENQVLISVFTRDYSFVAEEHLSKIFGLMAKTGVKLNVMKNSAISFGVCTDNLSRKVEPFVEALSEDFEVKLQPGLRLLTIRHFTNDIINDVYEKHKVILENSDQDTIQFVI